MSFALTIRIHPCLIYMTQTLNGCRNTLRPSIQKVLQEVAAVAAVVAAAVGEIVVREAIQGLDRKIQGVGDQEVVDHIAVANNKNFKRGAMPFLLKIGVLKGHRGAPFFMFMRGVLLSWILQNDVRKFLCGYLTEFDLSLFIPASSNSIVPWKNFKCECITRNGYLKVLKWAVSGRQYPRLPWNEDRSAFVAAYRKKWVLLERVT
jgi:hypothetical protein